VGTLTSESRELLKGRYYATLATDDEDGSVHLTPVWYLFEGDKFYVASHHASRKARNVSERPSASLVVDVRRAGAERWVSASGSAKLLTGEPSKNINEKIVRRYMTREAMDNPKVGPVLLAGDGATICLTPVNWRSWDMKALDAQFFGGVLAKTPERWFLPPDG